MPKVLQFPKAVEQPVERRRHNRYAVQLRCIVKVGDPNTARQSIFLSEVVNGSKGGYFIIARDSSIWDIGAELECIVKLPTSGDRQAAMRFNGKVVRVVRQKNGSVGVGIMLNNLCLPIPAPQQQFQRQQLRGSESRRFEMRMAA
jgi:hypothetical protein